MGDALEVGCIDATYTDCFNFLGCFICAIQIVKDSSDPIDANDVLRVLLGVGSVESADAQVVCSTLNCYFGFIDGRNGCSNDSARSENLSSFSDVHVILTKMHSFAPYSECYIDTVVDEEWNIVSFAFIMKPLSHRNEFTSVSCLVSVLNNSYPWRMLVTLYMVVFLLNGLVGRAAYIPPRSAFSTTSTKSLEPRIAGVESVTRYKE